MLSIKPIGSTGEEAAYYANLGEAENHDYYSEDGVRPGAWWGEGAKLLGLDGDVDPTTFKNLLEGRDPTGEKDLVQKRSGGIKRRAGFDLTFSVPKSLSVAWSQASEERRAEIDAVAEKALYRVLEVVQDMCGVTRRGKDGAVLENAKLLAAVFSHDTARGVPGEAPDANRHFHAVLANVVVREDGTTGSLDARPIFQRRMKMALGVLYRTELSKLLSTELGIETHRPQREGRNGLASWWEVTGVPQELTQAMSKRRVEIEAWLREHGLSGAKAAEKAALVTRKDKERYTWEELSAAWEKLGAEHGFTREDVEKLFSEQRKTVDSKAERTAAASRALDNLMTNHARFTRNELLEQTAIEAQTNGIGIDDVTVAIEELLSQSKEIVRLQDKAGVSTFTTREMLDLEKAMLGRAEALSNKSGHAVSLAVTNSVLAEYETLRDEQKEAVRQIAIGGDAVSITGVAGSGKTYMLAVAREVLTRSGYELLGTALAAKASKGLEEGSGIASMHIQKLLYQVELGRVTLGPKTVLVVDESGMVGTRDMAKIMKLVDAAGAKVLLVGDHKQLQAINAGAPFRAIGEKIGTTELTQIIRQTKAWARKFVTDLRDGRAEHALDALNKRGRLAIEADRETALEKLVSDWSSIALSSPRGARDTIVTAGTNADVREVNRRIQGAMREGGQLGEYAVECDGMALHLGDRIMVTKNNRLLSLENGATGEVSGVEGSTVWVKLDSGFEVEVDTTTFSNLTLGYAFSVHKSQGMTCENSLSMTGDLMTDRELSYVAGSRARRRTMLYTFEAAVQGIAGLAAMMNRTRQKEMANEYEREIE